MAAGSLVASSGKGGCGHWRSSWLSFQAAHRVNALISGFLGLRLALAESRVIQRSHYSANVTGNVADV